MSVNTKFLLPALLLCGALIIPTGCTRESDEAQVVDRSASETVATETTATETATEAVEPVRVSLIEYEIQMPSTLPAGPTSFQISNNGKEEHDFIISGNGTEKRLEAPLKPLEVASLDVELQPGTYEVRCPYEKHDQEHDMKTQLVVTAEEGTTTITTTDASTTG